MLQNEMESLTLVQKIGDALRNSKIINCQKRKCELWESCNMQCKAPPERSTLRLVTPLKKPYVSCKGELSVLLYAHGYPSFCVFYHASGEAKMSRWDISYSDISRQIYKLIYLDRYIDRYIQIDISFSDPIWNLFSPNCLHYT